MIETLDCSIVIWRKVRVCRQALLLQQGIEHEGRMGLVRLRAAVKTLGRPSMDIIQQEAIWQGVRNYGTECQTWYCRTSFSENVASRRT